MLSLLKMCKTWGENGEGNLKKKKDVGIIKQDEYGAAPEKKRRKLLALYIAQYHETECEKSTSKQNDRALSQAGKTSVSPLFFSS